MKLASMANYQQDGIIAVEYDTETETGSAYTIIDGVKEELPEGPAQHNAAGHLATEANYGGDLVSAQYDAVSGTGTASAVVDGVDIEIVGDAEEGNGILSITISPSITTTPALESFMPISYDDGHSNRIYVETVGAKPGATISFIVTPSSGWKIGFVWDESPEYGEVGEPYTITAECIDYEEGGVVVGWDAENNIYAANEDETETFAITLHVAGSLQ